MKSVNLYIDLVDCCMKLVNCKNGEYPVFIGLRYPTRQQSTIWLRRRQNVQPSDIAKEMTVSRPYVSQAQRIAEERIEKLLKHTAKVIRIELREISPQYGFAVGYCPANKSLTYITYSHQRGVQTWFTHVGDCASCDMKQDCEDTLQNLAHEWEISIPGNLPPTEFGEILFDAIMRQLKWK